MAKLRATHAPAAFGNYIWNTPDDVVDVPAPDDAILLDIADAGFEGVPADAPKSRAKPKGRAQITEPDPDAAPSGES